MYKRMLGTALKTNRWIFYSNWQFVTSTQYSIAVKSANHKRSISISTQAKPFLSNCRLQHGLSEVL